LYERLVESERKVWLTSEPSSGPIGQLIRLFFSGRVVLPSDPAIRDRQFAYLFAADRFDHLNNATTGILRQLEKDIDVISTRYVLSSLAYNVQDHREQQFIQRLNRDFPVPDCLIFLDCSPELSVKRMARSRPHRETYENYSKLKEVYENYKKVLKSYKGRKLIVSASLPKKEISEHVFHFVEDIRKRLRPATAQEKDAIRRSAKAPTQ
jgi:dTMP kinase